MKSISLISVVTSLVFATSVWAQDAKPAAVIPTELINKGFNTLQSAVASAGLIETLSAAGPFTFFAPNNAAFKKLPADQLSALLKDKEKLAAVLKNHIVEGKLTSADLKAGKVKTLGGAELDIKVAGGVISVNSAKVVKERKDVAASNGVIHGIDTVLLP